MIALGKKLFFRKNRLLCLGALCFLLGVCVSGARADYTMGTSRGAGRVDMDSESGDRTVRVAPPPATGSQQQLPVYVYPQVGTGHSAWEDKAGASSWLDRPGQHPDRPGPPSWTDRPGQYPDRPRPPSWTDRPGQYPDRPRPPSWTDRPGHPDRPGLPSWMDRPGQRPPYARPPYDRRLPYGAPPRR